MITYERGFLKILSRAFQCKGSVFPTSMCIALPCAALTALLKLCIDEGYLPALSNNGHNSILEDNSCWSGFVFLVGFLTVFRTSQAYARFWDGTTSMHHMRAEWFNACAALLAFCKYADATSDAVFEFQQTLVRLFSMLHAVALADIEDTNGNGPDSVAAYKYGLVDVGGIDSESLRVLKKSHAKAELVFQWIQQLIVENIDTGVLRIPPPILSRAFQEMANGMVAYHEAMKITTIPFPFPYAQVCDWLLLFHWVCTPLVVSQYVAAPWWGALFSFLQVFVYWSLNAIAVEIENPFGMDANDLDALGMQEELNRHLLLLLQSESLRTPHLVPDARLCETMREEDLDQRSFCEVWEELDGGLAAMAARAGVDEMAFVRGGSPVGSSDILPWLTATNRNKRSPSARSSRSSKHARGSRASNCSNHSAEPPSLRTSRQSVESPLPRLSQNSMYSSGLDSLKEEEFHCSVAQINDESLEEGTVSTEANRGKAPGRGEPAPLPRLVASSNEALNRVHKDIALLPGPQVFLPKRLGTGLPRPAGDRQEEEPQDTI
mmetsp:Transcript_84132/g.204040  ORF Transcript_84132/g.204040 Transcript_84132/m.204040 type:complete len:549 (+) Transcript_84132:68-1714(+)